MTDNDLTLRDLRGQHLSDALLGPPFGRRFRTALLADDDGGASLDDLLMAWVTENGTVTASESRPPPGALALSVRHWHISTTRLRWQVLLFVPLFVGDVVLGRGVSPTSFHGLLTCIQEAVSRLSDEERRILDRLRDQAKCLDGTTLELIGVGLSLEDRVQLATVIDNLIAAGVLRRSVDGLLQTVS